MIDENIQERFINNLNNSIHALAERHRGRGRYRNRNRESKRPIAFGHEKLDLYRAAITYVGWAYPERNRGRGRGRYRNRNRNRERKRHLAFGHEKLDVYRASIATVG